MSRRPPKRRYGRRRHANRRPPNCQYPRHRHGGCRCTRRSPAAHPRAVSDGSGRSPRNHPIRSSAARPRCARTNRVEPAPRPRRRPRRAGSRRARRARRVRPDWRPRRRPARASPRRPRPWRWRRGTGSSRRDERTGGRRIRSTAAWRSAPPIRCGRARGGRSRKTGGRVDVRRLCAGFRSLPGCPSADSHGSCSPPVDGTADFPAGGRPVRHFPFGSACIHCVSRPQATDPSPAPSPVEAEIMWRAIASISTAFPSIDRHGSPALSKIFS